MKSLYMVLLAFLVFVSFQAIAQEYDETWTSGMRQEFRKSCAAEMERVGVNTSRAWSTCDCMSAELEEEFGLAEFGYLTALEGRHIPDIDRRFDEAIEPCF